MCGFNSTTNPIWSGLTNYGAASTRTASTYIEWNPTHLGGGIKYYFGSDKVIWPGNSETAFGCWSGSGSPGNGVYGRITAKVRPYDGADGKKGSKGSSNTSSLVTSPPSGGNAWKKSTGFDDEAHDVRFELEVSPNPVNNYLSINLSSDQNEMVEFKIYSITGVLLMEKQFSKNTIDLEKSVDISNLLSGQYIVSIKQGHLEQNLQLIKN